METTMEQEGGSSYGDAVATTMTTAEWKRSSEEYAVQVTAEAAFVGPGHEGDEEASAGVEMQAQVVDEDRTTNSEEAPQRNADEAMSRDTATTHIQSVYRGCSTHQKLHGQEKRKQWIKQFDPSSQQVYFYNVETAQSQWEQPHGFVDGFEDPKTSGVAKIQSTYRSKKARDQVKSKLRGVGDVAAGDGDFQGVNDEDRGDDEGVTDATDEGSNVDAMPSVDLLPVTEDPATVQSERGDCQQVEVSAALSIQCAFRQHAAGKIVESRRSDLRDLTDSRVISQKINDLMHAMDEIQVELTSRQLASAAENEEFPHLQELLVSWTSSFDAIRDTILGLPHRAEKIQEVDLTAEKIVHAKFLHETMAETRSECLALLRSIFLMNSYFVELDVKRVNEASVALRKWKAHELCALADPRIMKVVQLDDLQEIFSQVETTLRRAMGLTDFNSGATTAAGKCYEEWHAEVAAALDSVHQMEQRLLHKIILLQMVRAAQGEKRELALMELEDFNSSQIEMQQRKRVDQAEAYEKFLVKCRESWQRGLEKRHDDTLKTLAIESAQHEVTARKMEIVEKMHKRDHHHRTTTKLSTWEAVKEGLPVEIVRTMVFAEMQKARRLGYDFVLRTARSDHGETLIQIACWWGHLELVMFLIEEGANVHDVDGYCNKFSLLHDAARRGHAEVIRILLQNGLSHGVIDSSGDTPLHWYAEHYHRQESGGSLSSQHEPNLQLLRAARKNHYEAVHTLLEAHVPCAEQSTLDVILKTVRTKNHRGKTPYQVAKSECVRRLIQAFDDGRLPLFRHPRTVAAAGSHRRMTDFTQHRSSSSRLISDLKGLMRTHSSKNFPAAHEGHGAEGHMPEDEFGIIDVFTPRTSEQQQQPVCRASSSKSVNK